MFSNERRMEVERIIVKAVIEAALAQGWTLTAVSNGEDETHAPSIDKAMEELFACDDSHAYFRKGEESGWFYFVLGNSGWDVVTDYTVNMDDVNAAVEPLIDTLEEEAYS